MLTDAEKEVLQKGGELFVAFRNLPEEHSADLKDVEFHIHAIQNIILARPGMREMREKSNIIE